MRSTSSTDTSNRERTMLRVAIDGPGGTGKSTIAKAVAERFGIEYIDTGAMYRALGLKSKRLAVDPADESEVRTMLDDTVIDFSGGRTMLDGEDVSGLIRTGEISMAASDISKLAIVRAKVDEVSRHLAATKDVVMEGRDIGTTVIPDAEVKIFMTASPEIRAKRRYDQLIEAGKEADYDQIYKETMERDYQDSHREVSPLRQAEDAVLLDTSDLTLEGSIDAVARIITEKTQK